MVKWREREREIIWEHLECRHRSGDLQQQAWSQSVLLVCFPRISHYSQTAKKNSTLVLTSILHVPESPSLSLTNMSCHCMSWASRFHPARKSVCCGRLPCLHVSTVSSWWSADGKLNTFESSFTSGTSLLGCLESGGKQQNIMNDAVMDGLWMEILVKGLNSRC